MAEGGRLRAAGGMAAKFSMSPERLDTAPLVAAVLLATRLPAGAGVAQTAIEPKGHVWSRNRFHFVARPAQGISDTRLQIAGRRRSNPDGGAQGFQSAELFQRDGSWL